MSVASTGTATGDIFLFFSAELRKRPYAKIFLRRSNPATAGLRTTLQIGLHTHRGQALQ